MFDDNVQPFRKNKHNSNGEQDLSAENEAAHTPVFQDDNANTFKDIKKS